MAATSSVIVTLNHKDNTSSTLYIASTFKQNDSVTKEVQKIVQEIIQNVLTIKNISGWKVVHHK